MSAEEQLDSLYARIPEVGCLGKCHVYCGPIAMSEPERLRILKRIGHPPFSKLFPDHLTTTGVSDLFMREALSKAGGTGCLNCPMLTPDHRCRVYDIRPVICRLWGAAEDLRCPYGCRPKRLLTRRESGAIIAESLRLQP